MIRRWLSMIFPIVLLLLTASLTVWTMRVLLDAPTAFGSSVHSRRVTYSELVSLVESGEVGSAVVSILGPLFVFGMLGRARRQATRTPDDAKAELACDDVSNGAEDDLKQATEFGAVENAFRAAEVRSCL